MTMPSYPHMLTEDTAVWTEYLKAPVLPIKRVWYDVHVGAIPVELNGAPIIDRKIAAGIYRKRIDVVALVGAAYWVIELKPLGSMLALGQVLAYSRLFWAEFEPAVPVWPVVICDRIDPDLFDDYELAGVMVIANFPA